MSAIHPSLTDEALAATCVRLAAETRGGSVLRASTGGVSATLRANAILLDATAAYGRGFFELARGGEDDGDVVVTHDRTLLQLFAALDEAVWSPGPSWAIRRMDEDVTLVRQPAARGFAYYVLWQSAQRVVVAVDDDDDDAPMIAVRALRSLLLRRIELGGAIFVHAAGVSDGSRCVLIAGPKFAGKTTTMVQLLHRGFDLLCNDKAALRADARSGVVALGFPIAAGVRIGALAALDDRAALLRAASPPRTTAELDAMIREHRGPLHLAATKLRFHPRDLAEACGAATAATRTVAGILLLRHDPDGQDRIDALPVARAATALAEVRLSGLDAIAPEHGFFGELGCGAAPSVDLRDVAARVPVFEIVRRGPRIDTIAALVADLTGAERRRAVP